MFSRGFVETDRWVVPRFEIEARKYGARSIEAEHMLLVLASEPEKEAAKLLAESGLDHQRLLAALHDEHRRSLAAAGVQPNERAIAVASRLDSSPPFGTSAKAALKRAFIESRGGRARPARLRSRDLLLGILLAELGTVPRALALAGVDRHALIARARAGVMKRC